MNPTLCQGISLISSWSLILLTVCLLLFFAVNLHNILRYHRTSPANEVKPEADRPNGYIVGLAAFGTALFFLESFLYLLLGILNGRLSQLALLDLSVMNIAILEFLGASIMVVGYTVFIWSVIARGRYTTSWAMPAKQRLVDWGPYRYVRHPSYLGYFLMFVGFFLMWHNILALIPFVAVPGYVLVTVHEEEMLMERFGEEYLQYRRRVGRFLPKTDPRKSR